MCSGKDLFDSDSDEDLFSTKTPVKSEAPEVNVMEKGRLNEYRVAYDISRSKYGVSKLNNLFLMHLLIIFRKRQGRGNCPRTSEKEATWGSFYVRCWRWSFTGSLFEAKVSSAAV